MTARQTLAAARRRLAYPDHRSRAGISVDGVTTEVFNCMRLAVPHRRHLWRGGHELYTCRGNPAPRHFDTVLYHAGHDCIGHPRNNVPMECRPTARAPM